MTHSEKLAYLEELMNEYWDRVGDDEFEKWLHQQLLKARLQKYKMEKNESKSNTFPV